MQIWMRQRLEARNYEEEEHTFRISSAFRCREMSFSGLMTGIVVEVKPSHTTRWSSGLLMDSLVETLFLYEVCKMTKCAT